MLLIRLARTARNLSSWLQCAHGVERLPPGPAMNILKADGTQSASNESRRIVFYGLYLLKSSGTTYLVAKGVSATICKAAEKEILCSQGGY